MHRRLGFEIWDTIRPFSYWSFDKKLFYIYKLYTKWINENINNKNHKFHIWEIDTIVTMMIMIKNGNGLAIENNDYKIIITAINKIRETIPPNTNEENVLTNLFSSILTQQLSSQRTFIPRLLYRYNFIFNHPNIIGVFREKFLIDPYDFLSFSYTLYMLFSTSPKFEYNDIIKKMNYLTFSQKCKVIIENISKSQNYYLCNIVENNIQTMSEFVYSFPFITKYPFIKYKSEYFLISPVHIVESCTIHLQDQLTQGNNDIKTEIGKVFEEYIYKLALNTRNYKNNEIVNDSKGYKADGRVFPGEDLVLKENDRIFLISCKSFTTPLSYRLSKKSKIEEVEQRYIDALKQSYRYFSHCGDQYKPFGENIDYSDRYSIILIVHSSGVKFNDIIKKFSMKYKEKPHLDSFKERIVFLYLHDFEDLLLSNNYITDTILYNRNKGYYNVLELNINNSKRINNEYNIFYNRISDDSVELIKSLFQNIE